MSSGPARTRGYVGIGAEGVSKSANVGALLRTAHAFDASFCFLVGTGFDARAGRSADTADTPAHVPCGALTGRRPSSYPNAACWWAWNCWMTRPNCRASATR